MSEILKALALEEEVTHGGKTWKLSGLTYEVQGAWEQWLRRRARAMLEADKDGLSPADYAAEQEALRKLIYAGGLSFWSEASADAMRSLPGQQKLAFLRIKVNHPTADEGEIQRVIVEQFEQLRELMDGMDHDPNPAGAAPTATAPAG